LNLGAARKRLIEKSISKIERGLQVAQVPGELVKHQRHAERQMLALVAGVPVGDGPVAEPAGRLLDDGAVSS